MGGLLESGIHRAFTRDSHARRRVEALGVDLMVTRNGRGPVEPDRDRATPARNADDRD